MFGMDSVLVSFLVLWQIPKNNLKRGFWLMVAVHAYLALLFLGLWWGRASRWKEWCSPHGVQEPGKGTGTKYTFQRHAPSNLLSPTRSHLLKFPLLSNSTASCGASLSTHEFFGDISHPKHSTVQEVTQSRIWYHFGKAEHVGHQGEAESYYPQPTTLSEQ
jgi:hypothetical protein